MNLKKNKEKNEQVEGVWKREWDGRDCGGECASLVEKAACVTAGRAGQPAACCLAENSYMMADCGAHHCFHF